MDATATTTDDLAARLRIRASYLWRHGRLPDLAVPTRFTELVQLRKLHDRDGRMPIMADKVAAKVIVADRLGPDWVVPSLWSGAALPETLPWRQPIVVKSRHGCNQNLFLRAGRTDWSAVRRTGDEWMRRAYGKWLDEWLYAHIPRGLLVEPHIGSGAALPVDYKIYVFHGQATHVQVHLDRATNHRWVMHDRDWRRVAPTAEHIARPSALAAMLDAAEVLASDFSFARVDFYQPAARPLFGEMTFYPGSGLDRFDPPWLDEELGRLWLRGRHAPSPLPFAVANAAAMPVAA